MVAPVIAESGDTTTVDPLYVPGGRPDEVWAHFHSGAVVQASRDRTRHYPGLAGGAPSTIGYYIRGEELRLKAGHVLDVGCGAGEGLRYLSRNYRRTTGVDKDSRALAFARQIAKESRLIQANLLLSTFRLEPVQLAYVVDVLGHLERPERALRILADRLASPQSLIVAEPSATIDQCLVPPARRAFTERSLHSLLLRGGFRIEQWLGDSGPFLAVQAVAFRDPCIGALADAETHFERRSLETALELATRACKTSLFELRFEAKLAKARILIELQRRDAATAVLLEARALCPTDARPPAALSQLARLAGNDSRALDLAREANSLDHLEVAGVCALGSLFIEEQPRVALDAWLVAHALAPDHSGVAAQLCDIALTLDDSALAITVLERLRRYSPEVYQANHSVTMAWLLAHSGRTLQARLEAKLAGTLAPMSPELSELQEFLKRLSSDSIKVPTGL